MPTSLNGQLTPTIAAAVIAGALVVGGGTAVAAKATIDGHDIARKSIPASKLTDQARETLSGARGPAGEAGPRGDTGAQGATGPQGATGSTGPVGETGPVGARGATGGTGEAGADGVTPTYYTNWSGSGPSQNDTPTPTTAWCDEGDVATGGGGRAYGVMEDTRLGPISSSEPTSTLTQSGWTVTAVDNWAAVQVIVICADLPPWHE